MTTNDNATLEWLVDEVNRLRTEVAELRQLIAPATISKTDAKSLRYRGAKSRKRRTVAEVMAAKRVSGSGCCDSNCDNSGCDCLEVAQRYEASIADCRECEGKGKTRELMREGDYVWGECERCKGTGKEPAS